MCICVMDLTYPHASSYSPLRSSIPSLAGGWGILPCAPMGSPSAAPGTLPSLPFPSSFQRSQPCSAQEQAAAAQNADAVKENSLEGSVIATPIREAENSAPSEKGNRIPEGRRCPKAILPDSFVTAAGAR